MGKEKEVVEEDICLKERKGRRERREGIIGMKQK